MLQPAQRYTQGQPRLVEGLTKSEMCQQYRGKLLMVARRLYRRFGGSGAITMEDLASAGAIGLLEAFERFDSSKGLKFSSFAMYRVRGAMHDLMRSDDSFTRRRRDLATKVKRAKKTVRDRQGRPAQPQEVAAELGVDIHEYWAIVDKVKPIVHHSLDRPVGDDDGMNLIEVTPDTSVAAPDTSLMMQDVRKALREAIAELPERERQCVLLYYGKDFTQAEIAAVFDVTVSRVSQILSQARSRLRLKLRNALDEDAIAEGL